VTEAESESVTVKSTLPFATAVGVPVIAPVIGLRLRPAGRVDALARAHEAYEPEPPLALS
jgi:hypothetical protein